MKLKAGDAKALSHLPSIPQRKHCSMIVHDDLYHPERPLSPNNCSVCLRSVCLCTVGGRVRPNSAAVARCAGAIEFLRMMVDHYAITH